jgi:hypothetical protein
MRGATSISPTAGNHTVMKVRPGGVLEPFAGNGIGFFSGEGEGA